MSASAVRWSRADSGGRGGCGVGERGGVQGDSEHPPARAASRAARRSQRRTVLAGPWRRPVLAAGSSGEQDSAEDPADLTAAG